MSPDRRDININYIKEVLMEKPVYITKKGVARLLNVSESTVCRWNKTRYIPSSFQLGPNRVVWDRREIEAWILSRKQLRQLQPVELHA